MPNIDSIDHHGLRLEWRSMLIGESGLSAKLSTFVPKSVFVTISSLGMAAANYRSSEIRTYHTRYADAFLKHLQIPTGYAEECQLPRIDRTFAGDPASHITGDTSIIIDVQKGLPGETYAAINQKLIEAIRTADAAAIAEIGEPQPHGLDGKPSHAAALSESRGVARRRGHW